MPVIKTSLSLDPRLAPKIARRGANRSGVINRDLERYYTLLDRALASTTLTEAEAWLLVDVLNGTIMDATTAHMLWAEVEDGIRLDRLADKWELDGPALVEKLRGLTELQSMVLVDAAERFWEDEDRPSTSAEIGMYFNLREEE